VLRDWSVVATELELGLLVAELVEGDALLLVLGVVVDAVVPVEVE
jgi:hypothetical protein